MTSDRFRFHNKERGKTGENERYKSTRARGDKYIRYVIPHRGITGEVPRSFPDLFPTVCLLIIIIITYYLPFGDSPNPTYSSAS